MGFKGSEVQILSPRPNSNNNNSGLQIISGPLFSFKKVFVYQLSTSLRYRNESQAVFAFYSYAAN